MFILVIDKRVVAASTHPFYSQEGQVVEVSGFDEATLGRAFYENGKVVVYEPLTVSTPTSATVNTPFTVTAALPAGSPDTEVQFRVAWQDADRVWHRTDPVAVAVVNGQASKNFQFATAGKYLIEALSEHHGLASAEVVVS